MKDKLANIISNVFNAFVGLILSCLLVLIVERERIPNLGMVMFLLIILPAFHTVLFKKMKLISDWEVSNRKERPAFLFSGTIAYFIALLIALSTKSELFINFAVVTFAINLLMAVISLGWKISGHMTYMTLLAFTSLTLFPSLPLVIFWCIILILVGWSRIYLKRHTFKQVVGGVLLGSLIPFLLL